MGPTPYCFACLVCDAIVPSREIDFPHEYRAIRSRLLCMCNFFLRSRWGAGGGGVSDAPVAIRFWHM